MRIVYPIAEKWHDFPYSAEQRFQSMKQKLNDQIPLLVIGGGVTGAGIALDAQTRGIQTVLLEMQDFASGTSSRSTKLIHGGLRYLKQLEFRLVHEVGRERAIVHRNGPHITKPEWMLLPIVHGGTYGKWATSYGLKLYDWLAGVKKEERRHMLSKQETLQKEPLLREEGLMGAGYYVEYRTDDARLTLEIVKKAVEEGAYACNYVKIESFLYEGGRVIGVRAQDLLTDKKLDVYAQTVINATGPWADQMREQDGSKVGKYLHWTKGAHIVVKRNRFPLSQAVYFDHDDGRMIFAIPRDNCTYIGTTDTDYTGDLERPLVTKEDRDYLLAAVNHMFPSTGLKQGDIQSSWAGIRPLIHEEGKSTSQISRKDELFQSPSGLITITGGKLTGYRKMAERVTDVAVKKLTSSVQGQIRLCATAHILYSGGDVGELEEWTKQKMVQTKEFGIADEDLHQLIDWYGSNVDDVFKEMTQRKWEAKEADLALDVYGALMYGIKEEMVRKPSDFFIRRTSSLYFRLDWLRRWQEPVLQLMKRRLGWTQQEMEQYRQELAEEVKRVTEY